MKKMINKNWLLAPFFLLIVLLPYSAAKSVVLLCAVISLFYTVKNYKELYQMRLVVVAWGGFALWYGLSLLWTEHPELVFEGLRKEILYTFLIFTMSYILIKKYQIWNQVICTLLFSGVLFAFLVILEAHSVTLNLGFSEFLTKQVPGVGDSSTFLALFSALGLVICFRKPVSIKTSTFFAVYEALMFFAMYATKNRMGLVCFAVLLMLVGLILVKQLSTKWKVIVLALIVPVSGYVLVKGFSAKTSFQGSATETIVHVSENDPRIWMWDFYLSQSMKSPVIGYGAGYTSPNEHFSDAFPSHFNASTMMHAHNVILNKVLQLGVIGLILFLFLYLSPFLCNKDQITRHAKLFLMLVLSIYFIKSMTDDFFIRNSLIMYWLVVGFVLSWNEDIKKAS